MKRHVVFPPKGMCRCKKEPRGDNGLEGYSFKSSYPYELFEVNDQTWVSVRPSEDTPDYWETCTIAIFKKYFEVLKQ